MTGLFLLALGGNLGSGPREVAQRLRSALAMLGDGPGRIVTVSPFYLSPAFPAGSGPDFVNAAATLESDESPAELLARLHAVEAAHGRERKARWGARLLDLDLLAAGDAVRPDAETWKRWRELPLERQMAKAPDELILPHPRIQDRAFVLVPLADVAPDWVHPVLGRSVRQMCGDLPEADRAALRPLPGRGEGGENPLVNKGGRA